MPSLTLVCIVDAVAFQCGGFAHKIHVSKIQDGLIRSSDSSTESLKVLKKEIAGLNDSEHYCRGQILIMT